MNNPPRDPSASAPSFRPLAECWICGAASLAPVHTAIFELSAYGEQDPGLAAYTGASVRLMRCGRCGFGQPEALPGLDDYFGRMYDQRWAADWMTGEFASTYKDRIFGGVLDGLESRVAGGRSLLDLGAHVGRLMRLAVRRGWEVEGVELNPSTAAFAASATGRPVHRMDAHQLSATGRRWDAVTLIDVLEHIPDPVHALEAAGQVLRPEGWIAVKVPHGPAQLRKEELRARIRRGYRATVADNLVHVNHFGVASLRRALERAGFGEVAIEIAPPELPPSAAVGGRLTNALRMATWRLGQIIPGGVESLLSLHLLAYARKP